mmetsp:Transcript_31419/g.66117  ORF Transcript_31419/g.66117 Transcript_31419/m.66117 type:complete len:337 (-) Transcript_31419:107-1117(-)|eukprot:CAMPEP_0172318658 /NCGR_PEP_ID=MMETSP1058-20130122/35487_1 /TAXON_ID=83371 /ORGANISM="Detonula confervacea, Strain CCMP 353" /LENGTH=336 /DNA_ID=CAMNT_0013033537 /DNA_START=16 /DNA_END=1026 /DNA_ORIENTATION=+
MKAVSSIIALLLPSVIVEGAASFIQPPSADNNADVNVNGVNDVQSISSQINEGLIKRLQELTEDTSKLEPIQLQYLNMEASSSTTHRDNDDAASGVDILSPERLARETLLTTRLNNIRLNRTRIDESGIEGAGRGLFAMEDIAKGEIITCYPGDALLCEYGQDDNLVDIDNNEEEDEEQYHDEEFEFINQIVIWGEHVTMEERMDEDAVFDGIEELSISPLTSYSVSLDGVYSVMGLPALDKDPAYYGHFANDGAGHYLIFENGHDNRKSSVDESIISAYALESVNLSNAIHELLDDDGGFALGGLHVVTRATKDIKEGEEILVKYGHDYWLANEF